MRIRFSVHNNVGLLVLFAVIAGLFASRYELSQLFLSSVVKPDALDYTIAISHFLFFTAFSGALIYINTRRFKTAENIRHFLFSLLAGLSFCLLPWLVFKPIIHESNRVHEEIYASYFAENQERIWENWEKEKRSYYFHDSAGDWGEKAGFLFLGIFVITRVYNMARKEDELSRRLEKLKNESLQSQISALNNQINPHFFFNALNALHSLIMEGNKDKSLEYVSNLSNVFRYILQSGKKDVVNLAEEVAFLATYRCMLAIKYGQRLSFDIRIEERYENCRLPVLSLLPVIENVSKHNEVSSRSKMIIEIFVEANYLVIRNEKKARLDHVDSAGIGLENLDNRFKLLTGQPIRISDAETTFAVYLPLLFPEEP